MDKETATEVKLPEPKYGLIYILQKNGDDPKGKPFPLLKTSCSIGRGLNMDIRVNIGSVSEYHCCINVDESSGEATIETFKTPVATELNDKPLNAESKTQLHDQDVIGISGRKFRFEYISPHLKSKRKAEETEKDSAEEEDYSGYRILTPILKPPVGPRIKPSEERIQKLKTKIEEKEMAPSTPAGKRVSFGPYLSPEQFDKALPPATPVKKGATPNRTALRGSTVKPSVVPITEEKQEEDEESEDFTLHLTACAEDESPDTTGETIEVDETLSETISSTTNGTPVKKSMGETVLAESIAEPMESESAETTTNEIAEQVVPGETAANEAAEEVEPTISSSQSGNTASNETAEEAEPAISSSQSDLLEPTSDNMSGDGDGKTSFKNVSTSESNQETVPGTTVTSTDAEEPVQIVPETPKADYSDVTGVKRLLQTPKTIPETPKPDYSEVTGVKRLLQTPKSVPETPKADYSDVTGVKRLLQTPESVPETPKADYSNVEGVAELLETPKPSDRAETAEPTTEEAKIPDATVAELTETSEPAAEPSTVEVSIPATGEEKPGPRQSSVEVVEEESFPEAEEEEPEEKRPRPSSRTPKADYTNVAGVKRLLRTPKSVPATPKADYSNVEGVQELMKTPKPSETSAVEEESVSDVPEAQVHVPVADDKEHETEPLLKSPKISVQRVEESTETPKSSTVTSALEEGNISNVPEAEEEDPEVKRPSRKSRQSSRTPKSATGTSTLEEGSVPEAEEEESEVKRSSRKSRQSSRTPKSSTGTSTLEEGSVPEIRETEVDASEAEKEESEVKRSSRRSRQSSRTPKSASATSILEEVSVPDVPEAEVHVPAIEEEEPEEKKPSRRARQSSRTPKADYTNVTGVKRLLRTPKAVPGTPKADYSNVEGVEELMKTPGNDREASGPSKRSPKTPDVETQDSAETRGTRARKSQQLVAEEEEQTPRSSKRTGKPRETPKADYSNISGVKRLLRTPRVQAGTPKADYTKVAGVKRLLTTPKVVQSPKADYTNIAGVKRLLRTPRDSPRSPKADYTNVSGVKRLFRSPRLQKTPEADYSDVSGVKELFEEEKEKNPPSTVKRSTRGAKRKTSESSQTTATRSLRRRAAEPAKASPSPSTPKATRSSRRTKKSVPLDDVELLHEGKGHAAHVHEEHVRSEAEDEPVVETRRKRGTHVHFKPEAATPATDTGSSETPAIAKPLRKTPGRRLKKDTEPEADDGSAQEELKPKTAKRSTRKARTDVPQEEVSEPEKKPTRTRRAKAAEPEPEPSSEPQKKTTRSKRSKPDEPEVEPEASPSPPKRTRSTRAKAGDKSDEPSEPVEPKRQRNTRKAGKDEPAAEERLKTATRTRKAPVQEVSAAKRSTRSRK